MDKLKEMELDAERAGLEAELLRMKFELATKSVENEKLQVENNELKKEMVQINNYEAIMNATLFNLLEENKILNSINVDIQNVIKKYQHPISQEKQEPVKPTVKENAEQDLVDFLKEMGLDVQNYRFSKEE